MSIRRRVAALLTVAALSACAPRGAQSGLRDGIVRAGVTDEPDSLNPLFSHAAVADDAEALVYASVLRYDENGVLRAELAREVPSLANGGLSADGRRVTLRFRPGLHWADGAPLDARDLAFTYRAVMNAHNPVKLRGAWSEITSLRLRDPLTAEIVLKEPDATILSIFASGGDAAYPPLPAHLFHGSTDLAHAEINAAPLSSGPWRLARWSHGSELIFVPNPRFVRGAPRLAGLRFVVLPDASTLVNALQTHEIDYIDAVPEDRERRVREIAGVRTLAHAVANYRHLDFNLRDPLLRDARVRRAIVEAIDWDRIDRDVYRNASLTATSDIFPTSWAAPQLPRYPYDPDHANELLEVAGWHREGGATRVRGDAPLILTVSSGNAKPTSARAELAMAADLERVGIHLIIKNAPVSYLFAQDGPIYGGRYQLAWMVDTRGPDPDNAAQWTTPAQPPNGANTVFLSDRIVDESAFAARRVVDRERRKALYATEEQCLHELAPSNIASWQRATVAFNARLRHVRPATYYSNFWNSWEWSLR